MALGAADAQLLRLVFDDRTIELPGEGGFRLFDATRQQAVEMPPGTLSRDGETMVYVCEGDDVRLRAEFSEHEGAILVRGELENLLRDDRGFLLDYWLPLLSPDAVFSPALAESARMADAEEQEANAFPLAAMCFDEVGLAMAIPPDEPRIFGLVGSERGMAIRFYLGVTPETRRFRNRASFSFLIYDVDPRWGFRSALSRYYRCFPERYRRQLPREGLFMFQAADAVPPNINDYGFNLAEQQLGPRVMRNILHRDDEHGIATFPYMIVGQREMKFLPELPGSYEEAMAIAERWTYADHAGHGVTKENTANLGDFHLREEIAASSCHNADGTFSLVLRETPWGGNSITFKTNPNPELFADEGRLSVGGLALNVAREWHSAHPQFDGTYVDSLGANWPAVLNYRRDHFAYAQHPLTVDPWGRPALHNVISHYEYIGALHRLMRSQGKLILGNGVYAYKSRGIPLSGVERQRLDDQFTEYTSTSAAPEHYRPGTKLGRFFCASLLDVASSEAGLRATVERCRDVRTLMGPKPYAFLSYHWEDAEKVEEFVNKSLAFGIYGTMTKNYFTGVEYHDHPQGYLRDKPLIDWYVPLLRKLNGAGWEPVTHARVDDDEAACERFGSGGTVYLTVYNDADEARTMILDVDLAGLGFDPSSVRIREIARNAQPHVTAAGRLTLAIESKRTLILALQSPEHADSG